MQMMRSALLENATFSMSTDETALTKEAVSTDKVVVGPRSGKALRLHRPKIMNSRGGD